MCNSTQIYRLHLPLSGKKNSEQNIFETARVSSEISIVVQYQMSRLYFSQQTQPAGQLFNIVVSDPE